MANRPPPSAPWSAVVNRFRVIGFSRYLTTATRRAGFSKAHCILRNHQAIVAVVNDVAALSAACEYLINASARMEPWHGLDRGAGGRLDEAILRPKLSEDSV